MLLWVMTDWQKGGDLCEIIEMNWFIRRLTLCIETEDIFIFSLSLEQKVDKTNIFNMFLNMNMQESKKHQMPY